MKVTEHFHQAKQEGVTRFSYEILPPERGAGLQAIIDIIEQIRPLDPPFIDVTAHASSVTFEEQADGTIKKQKIKKRPGTISICGVIQNRFNIDTVAHLLCNGFSKHETEDALIELEYLGIHNVLALQGDQTNKLKLPHEQRNNFASDLVNQITNFNQGKFLDESDITPTNKFCIGVAGYPEKHFMSPNQQEDFKYLQQKIAAGAEYITTQMFFDNKVFFEFQNRCHKNGINVPLIPGIKILTSVKQLTLLPSRFHVDLPPELVKQVNSAPQRVKEIGIDWAIRQCQELIEAGIPIIHFYMMNNPTYVVQVVKKLQN